MAFFLKATFLLMMMMTFCLSAFAQLQWGIKLGVNASTLSENGNICDDNDLRMGVNGGIISKVKMNEWMAIKSGIDYQLKGESFIVPKEDAKQAIRKFAPPKHL